MKFIRFGQQNTNLKYGRLFNPLGPELFFLILAQPVYKL